MWENNKAKKFWIKFLELMSMIQSGRKGIDYPILDQLYYHPNVAALSLSSEVDILLLVVDFLIELVEISD